MPASGEAMERCSSQWFLLLRRGKRDLQTFEVLVKRQGIRPPAAGSSTDAHPRDAAAWSQVEIGASVA